MWSPVGDIVPADQSRIPPEVRLHPGSFQRHRRLKKSAARPRPEDDILIVNGKDILVVRRQDSGRASVGQAGRTDRHRVDWSFHRGGQGTIRSPRMVTSWRAPKKSSSLPRRRMRTSTGGDGRSTTGNTIPPSNNIVPNRLLATTNCLAPLVHVLPEGRLRSQRRSDDHGSTPTPPPRRPSTASPREGLEGRAGPRPRISSRRPTGAAKPSAS